MATLKDGLDFIGSIGNITAYKVPGSDKTYIRRKGGASKEKIKTHPRFERTRQNNCEFGGCAKAVKSIRQALWMARKFANYNFTPDLTEICMHIQQQDPANPRGQRNVYLSRHRQLFEGFHLNNANKFTDAIPSPLRCTIDREKAAAVIQLPALLPGLNLQIPWKQPLYRLRFSLATAVDVIFDAQYQKYPEPPQTFYTSPQTDWQLKEAPFEARELTLQLELPAPLEADQTLIVAAGLEIGIPVSNN